VRVRANADGTEVAVAGGACARVYAPFRVSPQEVEVVDVGSSETHSHRRIFHLLGQNGLGRAGNLLVSELYADSGCWSGYPPHKHDEDSGTMETAHEEVYHFRFRPETGFGAQLCFQPDGSSQCFMTRHGDTFLLDKGYHPTVTSPGHEEYIFTILVGKSQRGLVQNFKEEHRHLMRGIPGIQDMVNKFK
jgi:5-deoxy-glucuronate isomerase